MDVAVELVCRQCDYFEALSDELLTSSIIPQSSSQQQTPYERKLAGIFGGPGAIMRTRYDANGSYRGEHPAAALQATSAVARNGMPKDYDPIWDSEHLYNSPHLSGNLAATPNTDIFVPAGYQGQLTRPTPHGRVVLINYAHLGNLNNGAEPNRGQACDLRFSRPP